MALYHTKLTVSDTPETGQDRKAVVAPDNNNLLTYLAPQPLWDLTLAEH